MDHSTALKNLCRVCGKVLVTKTYRVKYLCSDNSHKLQTVFNVCTVDDDPETHSQYFCHRCNLVIKKAEKLEDYTHHTSPFEGWCVHVESDCSLCDHYSRLQKGGRPLKSVHIGRPPASSPKYCIQRVKDIALTPLVDPCTPFSLCSLHQTLNPSHLTCRICSKLLLSPVELATCGSIVCAQCLCTWLDSSKSSCPCCHSQHIEDTTTIRSASEIVLGMLGSLCCVCKL